MSALPRVFLADKPLVNFILERHAIHQRRAAGKPKPWTADPILQRYRFCNVFRNLDTQSQLIQTNWLYPHAGEPDQWFAMVVARLVNWWPSLEEVGYPVPWRPAHFTGILNARRATNLKVYTGAYMVRADAQKVGGESGKPYYHANYVLSPMWADRAKIRPREGDCLDLFHQRLLRYKDMGSFMAAQVIADLKYDPKSPLHAAEDWGTWAASGPGSRRGLSRLLGRPLDYDWREEEWRGEFARLHARLSTPLEVRLGGFLSGQDLQNCLCELDKYQRVKLGEGRPRSTYPGVK